MRRLGPDFKTIADSRRDNGAAVVGACRSFVLLCRDARLFSARLVALNGSKFRAVVSARKVACRGRSRRKPPVSTFRSLSISRDCDEADAAEPGDAPEAVETALAALAPVAANWTGWRRGSREGCATLVGGEEDAPQRRNTGCLLSFRSPRQPQRFRANKRFAAGYHFGRSSCSKGLGRFY